MKIQNEIYYAHSMRIYNTDTEKHELKLIAKYFPSMKIFNPNQNKVQFAINPMATCLKKINDLSIASVVFSPFLEWVGRGVYEEVLEAERIGKPIYLIDNDEIIPFKGYLRLYALDWGVRYAKIKEVELVGDQRQPVVSKV